MATEIRIWEIANGKANSVGDTALADQHLEEELETWITQAPDILGDEFLVIDRQREISGVGRLDLLCIDKTGKLTVVELKRDRSPREAVAQALDYASWLNDAHPEQILDNAKEYLGGELPEAFEEHFHAEMPDVLPQNHRLLIVASRLDSSAERIVNYLGERYGVEINVLLLKYARLTGEGEVLVRTILLPESTRPPKGPRQMTRAQNLQLEFWTAFTEYCRQRGSLLKLHKPAAYLDYSMALGRAGISLALTFKVAKRSLGCEVNMIGGQSKLAFELLEQQRLEIEKELGALQWDSPAEEGKFGKIAQFRNVDLEDHDVWPELIAWLKERAEAFYNVFSPRVKDLKLQAALESALDSAEEETE